MTTVLRHMVFSIDDLLPSLKIALRICSFWLICSIPVCICFLPQQYLILMLLPVYYRDNALRLALPPGSSFSKWTASSLVLCLIASAQHILHNEQQRVQSGTKEADAKLIAQLTGIG